MADVCISLAGFAKHRRWLPTVEIKCSFLAPLPVGPCLGEGRVLKSGRGTVFLEAKLWTPEVLLAFHATATATATAHNRTDSTAL
jgi:acyl-coenzyme A thioesterase PaaI-like protein